MAKKALRVPKRPDPTLGFIKRPRFKFRRLSYCETFHLLIYDFYFKKLDLGLQFFENAAEKDSGP